MSNEQVRSLIAQWWATPAVKRPSNARSDEIPLLMADSLLAFLAERGLEIAPVQRSPLSSLPPWPGS